MTTEANTSTRLLAIVFGLGSALLVGIGLIVGAAISDNQDASQNVNRISIPKGIPLEAGTSSVGKKISMGTGAIDSDIEGLFVLDHLTGTLTCYVVNPRGLGGPLIGQFTANVANDLGQEKVGETDYVLSVGGINALRGGGNQRPAQCVVYVADGNSGNVVGYSLAWDQTRAKSNTPQAGLLIRVMLVKARPNIAEE